MSSRRGLGQECEWPEGPEGGGGEALPLAFSAEAEAALAAVPVAGPGLAESLSCEQVEEQMGDDLDSYAPRWKVDFLKSEYDNNRRKDVIYFTKPEGDAGKFVKLEQSSADQQTRTVQSWDVYESKKKLQMRWHFNVEPQEFKAKPWNTDWKVVLLLNYQIEKTKKVKLNSTYKGEYFWGMCYAANVQNQEGTEVKFCRFVDVCNSEPTSNNSGTKLQSILTENDLRGKVAERKSFDLNAVSLKYFYNITEQYLAENATKGHFLIFKDCEKGEFYYLTSEQFHKLKGVMRTNEPFQHVKYAEIVPD